MLSPTEEANEEQLGGRMRMRMRGARYEEVHCRQSIGGVRLLKGERGKRRRCDVGTRLDVSDAATRVEGCCADPKSVGCSYGFFDVSNETPKVENFSMVQESMIRQSPVTEPSHL